MRRHAGGGQAAAPGLWIRIHPGKEQSASLSAEAYAWIEQRAANRRVTWEVDTNSGALALRPDPTEGDLTVSSLRRIRFTPVAAGMPPPGRWPLVLEGDHLVVDGPHPPAIDCGQDPV